MEDVVLSFRKLQGNHWHLTPEIPLIVAEFKKIKLAVFLAVHEAAEQTHAEVNLLLLLKVGHKAIDFAIGAEFRWDFNFHSFLFLFVWFCLFFFGFFLMLLCWFL